jgi:putative sterol carrier protein
MTWQEGKLRRQLRPSSPFAPLTPLAAAGDDPATALENLARALDGHPNQLRLEIRLVAGAEGDGLEHWQVPVGAKDAKPKREVSKGADVIVVMRPETWLQIAQGSLAPYDALFGGRLRVGGDFEAAKAITQSLSDPARTYVPPC